VVNDRDIAQYRPYVSNAPNDTSNLSGLVMNTGATGRFIGKDHAMPSHKARLTKSLGVLTKEVADIAELAKKQRHDADSQHANAHDLEIIGAAIDDNATALKAELEKI
jgi:hypothetical protein